MLHCRYKCRLLKNYIQQRTQKNLNIMSNEYIAIITVCLSIECEVLQTLLLRITQNIFFTLSYVSLDLSLAKFLIVIML